MSKSCPYWKAEHHLRMSSAKSFEEIAAICVEVINSMPQPIVQLCGPISTGGFGHHDKNLLLFGACVRDLRVRGLNPFDQVPMQIGFKNLVSVWREKHPGERYCWPILETVYAQIFETRRQKATYFLPGWHTSIGTTWERYKAARCGIEVLEFPVGWYHQVMEEVSRSEEFKALASAA